MSAAVTLFEQQGYDETTIAEIAEAAGLTKRTFFRYFADQLIELWVAAVAGAPPEATPMAAVCLGLDAMDELFSDLHTYAGIRSRIINANPELRERELIKLQSLADAIKLALRERGVALNAAILAAQAGVTVFHVAFARWVEQDDPTVFGRLMEESLGELRSVTAAA